MCQVPRYLLWNSILGLEQKYLASSHWLPPSASMKWSNQFILTPFCSRRRSYQVIDCRSARDSCIWESPSHTIAPGFYPLKRGRYTPEGSQLSSCILPTTEPSPPFLPGPLMNFFMLQLKICARGQTVQGVNPDVQPSCIFLTPLSP